MGLAQKIMLVVAGTALPALLLALGCSDKITGYAAPPHGETNGNLTPGDGSYDAGIAPIDLCACSLGLAAASCTTCNKQVIQAGAPCDTAQSACQGDTACVMDAECVGTCLKDAGNPEPACVAACLSTAGTHYKNYISCICHQCTSTCVVSGVTCP